MPGDKNKYGFKKTGFIDLELPSGGIAQVKRPNVQGLLKAGLLQSMDGLTGIVSTTTIPKAQGLPGVDTAALMKDPESLKRILDMIDKIVLHVVVQPEVLPVPEDENDRDNSKTYIDEVDDDDKMFIMQHAVSGDTDLQRFRERAEIAMGSVAAVEAATAGAQ
jgi:hypothetical protein